MSKQRTKTRFKAFEDEGSFLASFYLEDTTDHKIYSQDKGIPTQILHALCEDVKKANKMDAITARIVVDALLDRTR